MRKDTKGRILQKGETQLKNGNYIYRWKDYYGNNNKIHATTLNELREKKEIAELYTLEKKEFTSSTLNELIERWLFLKQNLKTSSLNAYAHKFETSIKPTELGRKRIVDIKQSDIIYFLKQQEKQGLKASTINISYTIIKQSLEFAYNEGMILRNTCLNVEKLKTQPITKKALTDMECDELLDRIQSSSRQKYLYNIVGILMYTGMRISEAAGLLWSNVDIEKGEIYIVSQFVRTNPNSAKRTLTSPKTESSKRTIYMTDFVKELFIKQKEYCEINNIVSDFVFVGHTGNPISIRSIERALVTISNANKGREISLPKVTPHMLRHIACTKMINSGMKLKTVQTIMGHASSSTTLDVYTHVNDDYLRSDFKKMK